MEPEAGGVWAAEDFPAGFASDFVSVFVSAWADCLAAELFCAAADWPRIGRTNNPAARIPPASARLDKLNKEIRDRIRLLRTRVPFFLVKFIRLWKKVIGGVAYGNRKVLNLCIVTVVATQSGIEAFARCNTTRGKTLRLRARLGPGQFLSLFWLFSVNRIQSQVNQTVEGKVVAF